jgi:hypothetical protein
VLLRLSCTQAKQRTDVLHAPCRNWLTARFGDNGVSNVAHLPVFLLLAQGAAMHGIAT